MDGLNTVANWAILKQLLALPALFSVTKKANDTKQRHKHLIGQQQRVRAEKTLVGKVTPPS